MNPSHTLVTLAVVFATGCIGTVESTGPGGGGGDDGSGSGSGSGSGGGTPIEGLVFGPYKDTSISMNWNTNVISTNVTGTPTALADDLIASGGKTVTLAFATGECGSESWGGVPGAAMATANAPRLNAAGVRYMLATGGAAGSFACGSDTGFATMIDRWAGAGLVGVDFDIEAGQSKATLEALVARTIAAHTTHPELRFSFTLATLANNAGATTAKSLGSDAPDSFNAMGVTTLAALTGSSLGQPATWPSYLTIDLMVMDYGAAGPGVCVVKDGICDMGQSAVQATYNLHDHWNVPFANIELTPMIGGNDNQTEHFTLADVDTLATFAAAQKLAGVHYWSYDRDTDCPIGSASPTCNSLGGIGTHGFLAHFLAAGMR